MLATTIRNEEPRYQPLTTLFGQNWPAQDTKLLPDFHLFDPDHRRSQSIQSRSTRSKRTITPRDITPHATPHNAVRDLPILVENTDTWDDLDVNFDDILFNTEFDPSCLHALDNQLLLSPIESFVDLCWAEAVIDDDSDDIPAPRAFHISPTPEDASVWHSDLEDGDRTPTDGASEGSHLTHTKNFVHLDSFFRTPASPPLSNPLDDSKLPLVLLGAHFPARNPDDSIHFFPVSPLASRRRTADRRLPHTRIAAFCSNLPGRLVKSSSAA